RGGPRRTAPTWFRSPVVPHLATRPRGRVSASRDPLDDSGRREAHDHGFSPDAAGVTCFVLLPRYLSYLPSLHRMAAADPLCTEPWPASRPGRLRQRCPECGPIVGQPRAARYRRGMPVDPLLVVRRHVDFQRVRSAICIYVRCLSSNFDYSELGTGHSPCSLTRY